MSELSINAIRSRMTLSEYVEARQIFEGLKIIEPEQSIQIALLYWIGFVEGKRAERAKRRKIEWKALEKSKDSGFVVFNENGMPENWKRS